MAIILLQCICSEAAFFAFGFLSNSFYDIKSKFIIVPDSSLEDGLVGVSKRSKRRNVSNPALPRSRTTRTQQERALAEQALVQTSLLALVV
jgi:hypothetical protein